MGFRVEGLGWRVEDLGYIVFGVSCFGCRAVWVNGVGFWGLEGNLREWSVVGSRIWVVFVLGCRVKVWD